MQQDQKLIAAALDSRTAYGLIAHHLAPEDLGPQAEMWWALIERWYKADMDAARVDWEVLRDSGERTLPSDHRAQLLSWFDSLEPVASPANIAQDVLGLKKANLARELAGVLLAGKEAGPLLSEYSALEEATSLEDSDTKDGHWAPDDILEIIDGSRRENLIPVFPKSLRAACDGGVEPGDHIVVFARPEMGKSLFALNMAAGWVRTGHRVLYVGNEDGIAKLKRRLICNLANMTPEQLRKWPEEAMRRAEKNGIGLIRMWWQRNMTIDQLEAKIRETQPQCVILDQIRGMSSRRGDSDGMTQKLEDVAIGFRGLLGKYGLVGLSTNQGNDRTERHNQEPPVWLSMGDVADSRTGLPGQADLLLGIGANSDMQDRGERAMSILKNKGEGSHTGFRFWVDPLRTRIR